MTTAHQRPAAVRWAAAVEDALDADRTDWRLVVETMPQIVWITRPDGWHEYFNRTWLDFTGLTLEESLGHGWNPPFHPDDRERAAARWREATRTGQPYEIEYRLRRADGVHRWMLGRAVPIRDATGAIVRWFGTCTDIEELKLAQARIADQVALLDRTQDAIVVHDLDHRVQYWNAAAERIYGWSAEEAVGQRLEDFTVPDIDQVRDAVQVLLREGEWSGELCYRDRDGDEVLLEGRWSLLRDDDGTPRAALAVNTDVTERRRIETRYLQALEARATQDPLTGLANRTVLFDRLELLLDQRRGSGTAVAFLDLDDFKVVNDRFGHRVGDELLRTVADRLRATVRQGDLIARIGGDEFVVAGEAEDRATALGLGERLAAAVGGTVRVGDRTVDVGASVGVAFIDRSDDVDAEAALSRADEVMYGVKRASGSAAAIEASDATKHATTEVGDPVSAGDRTSG